MLYTPFFLPLIHSLPDNFVPDLFACRFPSLTGHPESGDDRGRYLQYEGLQQMIYSDDRNTEPVLFYIL